MKIGPAPVLWSAPRWRRDGHTVLIVANSFFINPAVRTKLPYDAKKDFAGVARLASTPMILAAHPSLPAKTLKELIEVVNRLSTEILRALQLAEVKDIVNKAGLNVAGLPAAEFDTFLRNELHSNEEIVRAVKLRLD